MGRADRLAQEEIKQNQSDANNITKSNDKQRRITRKKSQRN